MVWNKNKKTENVLILGLGGVGFYLAKRLFQEGYHITVIESDSALIQRAGAQIEARLINGNAMSVACWREAEAGDMDFFIAATNNDAVNMLSSMIADRFGIRQKIARIRSLEFGNENSILDADDLKIDLIIHPEELAAQEIVRLIKRTAGNEITNIAQGQMQLIATRINESSPFAHKKLSEVSQISKDLLFRVVSIARKIKTIIPGGDQEILPQDQVLIMTVSENLSRLMEFIGVKQHSRHGVMILGGGLVGSRVAELLGNSVEVKLIERNLKRAEELAHTLEYAEVLRGDGAEANVLALAGLADMDTFITTTGENQINIMSCLMAKNLMKKKGPDNQGKTIAMINKEEYLVLATTIGADIALNKKILAGNEILKFIRRGELLSVAHLHGFDTEVVEIVPAPKSPITRAPLSKLGPTLHGKILIGGVFRNGKWETATGKTHIQVGERVIASCPSQNIKDVRGLFLA